MLVLRGSVNQTTNQNNKTKNTNISSIIVSHKLKVNNLARKWATPSKARLRSQIENLPLVLENYYSP